MSSTERPTTSKPQVLAVIVAGMLVLTAIFPLIVPSIPSPKEEEAPVGGWTINLSESPFDTSQVNETSMVVAPDGT